MATSDALRVHVLIDALGFGGAEMLLGDLAAGAAAADLALSVGYLFSRDGDPAAARLRVNQVEPTLVPVRGLLRVSDHGALRRHLREVDPDVVHTHLEYADFFGGVAARRLGLPAVSTIHVMRWPQDLRERTKLRLQAAVRRRCMEAVLCLSGPARDAYLKSGWGRSQRVLTVPNGIAGVPQTGAGPSVRAELGISRDAVVATMLTVLRPGKGHMAAIDALLRAREQLPELELVIAGDGPSRDAIARHARGAGAAVRLLGHRDDAMALLDASDMLVHPSDVDAFPTALLEAMAARVPVLATRVGGIPEIVAAGETGLLVDAPADATELAGALVTLARDARLRVALGTAGRERFEGHFTAAAWAQRLAEVYRDAIRRSRRTSGDAFAAKRSVPSP